MGTNIGPKIVKAALDFALDSSSNTRGYTKYGTSGANNSNRAAINFATKGTIDISTTSNFLLILAAFIVAFHHLVVDGIYWPYIHSRQMIN